MNGDENLAHEETCRLVGPLRPRVHHLSPSLTINANWAEDGHIANQAQNLVASLMIHETDCCAPDCLAHARRQFQTTRTSTSSVFKC